MSSSDKFPDWDVFTERPVPEDFELLSPASEVASDLQKIYQKMNDVKSETDKVRREGIEPLVQQAIFVYKFEVALEMYEAELQKISQPKSDVYRHLRVLKDQMIEALASSDVELISPVGEPFENVVDYVDMVHWRYHEDYTSEIVVEVLEPIIKFRGDVVKLARLVIGAPLGPEDKSKPKAG
ncbi:MAG: nucleotide exchange factor GrpE [Syntrophobacterales bacterium]|nr:nucleotide exchange factor GrpE [Syntrophobacterales bacterium]